MARYVVTGANRGVGLEFARQLSARGDEVIALCRKTSEELASFDGVSIIENVELRVPKSFASLTDVIGGEIDVLINNAGVLRNDDISELDFESISMQLQINAIAPLALVAALKSRFSNGAKVSMITSRMGSIADNGSGGYYGYRMSKAALSCYCTC